MEINLIFSPESVDEIKTKRLPTISEKESILKYFSLFEPKAYSGSKIVDIVDNKTTDLFNNMFSDGKYTWTSLTVYLFKNYNLKLNDDFIQYVLSQTK